MPDEVRDRTAPERRAQEASVFLTFQSRVTLSGDAGFIRDIQSVLFQPCVHVPSPRLLSRQLVDANAFLVHALYAHAQLAWTDVPAHQHYLLSVLFEHLDDRNAALHFLCASLENSSPYEHDFLTKAQSYGSQLIELGRMADAKELILDICRKASRKDLPEVRELVEETFAVEAGVQRAS